MVWNRRSLEVEVQECLAALPAPFAVTEIGAAHVIVGPTGVFVALVHDGKPERARSLGRLAATIRSAFAEHMAWVPFVHALLVDDRAHSVAQATVVPADLLREVLTEGRHTLERETIETIARLMSQGALRGLEAVAPIDRPAGATRKPSPDASMTECSDSQPEMTSS